MRLVREATRERLRVLWKAATSPRLVFHSLGWILVFAGADVLIVQGVFGEAARNGYGRIWSTIGAYHLAMFYLVFPVTTFAAFRWKAWAPILLSIAGWEDIFYFWLQGRAVDASLPWLVLHPTAPLLYAHAIAALAFVIVVTIVIPFYRQSAKPSPPGSQIPE